MAVQVPFCREILEEGMSGNDIVAHKRALSRHDPKLYPWHQFTPYFGEFFGNAVEKFNERHGLNIKSKKRKITVNTHEKLERVRRSKHPDEWAFDAYGVKLATDFCVAWSRTPETKIRQRIVDAWHYWYTIRDKIGYDQYRPTPLLKPPSYPDEIDCSGFFKMGWYAGGAQDPDGGAWDGYGYTGSLMTKGTRVTSVTMLLPGDAVFYGFVTRSKPGFNYGDPTHMAGYAGQFLINGRWKHMVYSMGSASGPHFYEYNYRSINQRAGMRHLEVFDVRSV